MKLDVQVDATNVVEKLDTMPARLRQELLTVEEALESALLTEAQKRAPVRTGDYLASIGGGVRSSANGVWASVFASDPIAHIVEHGADIPAHDIYPDAMQALHFTGSAGEVFARHVSSPGAHVPAQNVMEGALGVMESTIQAALERVIDQEANRWL